MSTSVFYRRRAERFAQTLDEAGGARRHHTHSRARSRAEPTGDEELVALGQRLATMEFAVRADPEFRTGLRAMLMATMERDGIGASAVDAEPTREVPAARHRRYALPRAGEGADDAAPRRRPAADDARPWYAPVRSRRARGAIVIGLAAGTLAVSGMSAASGNANPGDALYGVKRSTERAQLALAGSELSRGQLYLEFAKTRMNEALAIRDDPTGLANVLADMDAETRQGVRQLTSSAVSRREAAALDVVDAFVASQRRGLGGLTADQPGVAGIQLRASLALLTDIQERAAALRTWIGCAGTGPSQPDVLAESALDSLGPLPGQCGAAAPSVTGDTGPGPTSNSRPVGTGSSSASATATPSSTPSRKPSASPSPAPSEDSGGSDGGLIGDLLPSIGLLG